MVISTGITEPRWPSVAALYALTNSMMLTPWGPSAVPTGGAGVAAPALIWVMVACRVANGPSTTMTESDTSKSATSTFLRDGAVAAPPDSALAAVVAAATTAGASIFSTSSRLRGTGCWLWPTKPVTDGVWRTADQDSSVRSMRTST